MAIITLTTDLGLSDHYVAAVKAKIFSLNPGISIVDISHEITHYSILHASHTLKSVYQDFQEGSIHVTSVHSPHNRSDNYIAAQINGHYFIGIDNGLFGLICNKEPTAIVQLGQISKLKTTFPAKDIFAPAAAKLASGASLHDLGPALESMTRLVNKITKASLNKIVGHVIHVDHYGNLITNIDLRTFKDLCSGKNYEIAICDGREIIDQVSESYNNEEEGSCFANFNDAGLLEIGINFGNASSLLGMKYDSVVAINNDN